MGVGGILLFSPTVWVGVRGRAEGHTQEHTQERTRECCTYPLATYPLKSARLEASNALNYRAWLIPAVLSRGIPGNALRAFPGSFR